MRLFPGVRTLPSVADFKLGTDPIVAEIRRQTTSEPRDIPATPEEYTARPDRTNGILAKILELFKAVIVQPGSRDALQAMAAKAYECPIGGTYAVGPLGGRKSSQFDNDLWDFLKQDCDADYEASKAGWRLEIGQKKASPNRVQACYYVETTVSWLPRKESSDDCIGVLCVARLEMSWLPPEQVQVVSASTSLYDPKSSTYSSVQLSLHELCITLQSMFTRLDTTEDSINSVDTDNTSGLSTAAKWKVARRTGRTAESLRALSTRQLVSHKTYFCDIDDGDSSPGSIIERPPDETTSEAGLSPVTIDSDACCG